MEYYVFVSIYDVYFDIISSNVTSIFHIFDISLVNSLAIFLLRRYSYDMITFCLYRYNSLLSKYLQHPRKKGKES